MFQLTLVFTRDIFSTNELQNIKNESVFTILQFIMRNKKIRKIYLI